MILIKQSPEQAKEAITLQRSAIPSTFRFVETQTRCVFELQQIAKQVSESGGMRPTIDFQPLSAHVENGRLLLRTRFTFRATLKSQDEQLEVFRVSCNLEVAYRLNAEFTPTDTQIAAFHSAMVIFHCWPYFREFVQSSITRAGYPAPDVPFLQLQVTTPKPASRTVADASKEVAAKKKHKQRKPAKKTDNAHK